MNVLARWARLVESAAEPHEPHRACLCPYDVAAAFHGLWNKGKDDASLRFLSAANAALTAARFALGQAAETSLASGLEIMGSNP
jgi:arginyl-tRNA synthetase